MKNVELKRKVSLKRKGGDDSQPEKSKWWLWLLLLVVVAVVVVLGVKKCSSNGDENTGIEPAIVTEQPATTQTEEIQGMDTEGITIEIDERTVSEETVTPATVEEVPPPTETERVSASVSKPAITLPQGTLDEKAKQVIRGNFGSGVERKQALGNEYDAIQQRVNEMYREGKVK